MNKNKRAVSLVLAGLLTFSLSGCSVPRELGTDRTGIDILKSDGEEKNSGDLESGIIQELEVPGETFKLLVNYSVNKDTIWRVNDTKNLNMKILTKGLPKGVEVYIDNIHADTTIVSDKARYDGILQDSMDDRIHNSLMLGFPISDTVSYYGTNIIEGQNKEFLTMWSY